MQKVEAIIRREKFSEVDAALKAIDVVGLTCEDVNGRGRAKGADTQVLAHGKWTYEHEYVRRIKLEAVVNDEDVEKVTKAIIEHAGSHSHGDGMIFVTPVYKAIDISAVPLLVTA